MKFSKEYLDSYADKLLENQEKFKAFEALAKKQDHAFQIKKCLEKVEAEYTFWEKKDTESKQARLKDLEKDLTFLKRVNSLEVLTPPQKQHIQLLTTKYALD